jgi:hypothetical protein
VDRFFGSTASLGSVLVLYSFNVLCSCVIVQEGHSVLAHVHDFLPYFWVAAPRGFANTDCHDFANYLNVSISHLFRFDLNVAHPSYVQSIANSASRAVQSVTVAHKRSLWGYKGDPTSPFLKIIISDYKLLARVRDESIFRFVSSFLLLSVQALYVSLREAKCPFVTFSRMLKLHMRAISRTLFDL